MASWAVAELRLGVNFTVGKICIVCCFKCETQGRFDWIPISRNCAAAHEVLAWLLLSSPQQHVDLPLREMQVWASGTHTWPPCMHCATF